MRRNMFSPGMIAVIWICLALLVSADDYTIAEGNKSLLVAVGCFWCGEQAFEQYAPGVVEVVSGYAGGTNDNPTYRNHPGHYEVILIEYDPAKTSYEVLVDYAYRNMDPFDGAGQFCDKGPSYYPAIFYDTEEELATAESVLTQILEEYPDWKEEDIAAPILERPKFWTAEEYHQDYYIKNPGNYGYYKNACRRPQRLKEVWGEDVYECYHDEGFTCFTNSTAWTIFNDQGELVEAESNVKNAAEEKKALLPKWQIMLISVIAAMVGFALILCVAKKCSSSRDGKKIAEPESAGDGI